MIAIIDKNLVKKWSKSSSSGQIQTPVHINIDCPNPECNESLINRQLGWSNLKQNDAAVSECTCMSCGTNISFYIINAPVSNNPESLDNATLIILPPLTAKVTFSDGIRELSSEFVSIYSQAKEAEMHGLNRISGMGYRKAVEFLIKDYLIKQHPDKEDEIKKELLGKCIAEYVDNINIKECARRTVWLGNDETHYVRNWENRDINDLKILINLTVHWLDMELLSNSYVGDMRPHV